MVYKNNSQKKLINDSQRCFIKQLKNNSQNSIRDGLWNNSQKQLMNDSQRWFIEQLTKATHERLTKMVYKTTDKSNS